ncbi:efflux RND transporter periplasmic adaptor subunit [Aquicoccus sp. G2-2]|uniref:efflux RND transporter periplasmic adaptor subunit n=1 Tax=Aquicoccus sp. G2-2 TaxID=3092120 RepID=UPI002AE089E2|nr:HlyD family efflux transporter periplasmic adaptor subunit [Aquicoccus sp. G2-2]MEA1112963.1 HlyD family efflux transporter periplasmic adaptor subunit [Aquicoccus sp. G2-2]
MRAVLREVHWAAGWLDARLWQGQAASGMERADSAKLVLDLLAAANEHQRFDGAALALVNAVPEMTGFDSAAVGMMRGRRVRLEALSRDAGFTAKARLTRAYEAAMAEAADQSAPVGFPERPDGRQMITLAHAALAREIGAALILSVPLLVEGRVEGVLCVAKATSAESALALDPSAVGDLTLAAAALGPGLKTKLDERRWISGRGRALGTRAATALLGRRPALALASLAVLAVLAALTFAPAELRVHADATLKGATQRSILAPQEGFIAEADVKAGEHVTKGALLARLDDRELRVEEAAARARLAKAEQDWRTATASGKRSEAAIATTTLDETRAALALIEARLARLDITAPQAGLVIAGDLSQQIGAPVAPGDPLFEIATTGAYRLFIDVSEYDLELVHPGQQGRVSFSGLASLSLPFTVTTIASVSDPGAGENRFRVEADIAPTNGLRPGLTGTAKIETGQARLGWVLLRGTAVRLRLWAWRMLP